MCVCVGQYAASRARSVLRLNRLHCHQSLTAPRRFVSLFCWPLRFLRLPQCFVLRLTIRCVCAQCLVMVLLLPLVLSVDPKRAHEDSETLAKQRNAKMGGLNWRR